MKDFEDYVAKSYAFNPEVYKGSERWRILRGLYYWSYHFKLEIATQGNIPKMIHQIWLGGELPDQYKMYCDTWKKMHPDWTYKLWTDKDVNSIHITRRKLFDHAVNLGMKSDILRYEILKQYGGVYVDTDFECIKPLDDLSYLDFYTGVGYDTEPQLYIGLIASIPNHPIIQNAIDGCGPIYTGNRGSSIMNITGANVFTDAFFDFVDSPMKNVVAFPPAFFYPFPNNLRNDVVNRNEFISEETYAVHHWAVSWIKKRKV